MQNVTKQKKSLIPRPNPCTILSRKGKENQWSAAYQNRIYAVYDFGKNYLINCVIIRLLMRRQNSTWTSGQPAGYITINLWWHQTSVQALMQNFLIINPVAFFFPSMRNTNSCLIVIGLLQVAHAVQATVVGILKTHRTLLILKKNFFPSEALNLLLN